jgi:hypothetical protein
MAVHKPYIYQLRPKQDPKKLTQIAIFGLENLPSGNPGPTPLLKLLLAFISDDKSFDVSSGTICNCCFSFRQLGSVLRSKFSAKKIGAFIKNQFVML